MSAVKVRLGGLFLFIGGFRFLHLEPWTLKSVYTGSRVWGSLAEVRGLVLSLPT